MMAARFGFDLELDVLYRATLDVIRVSYSKDYPIYSTNCCSNDRKEILKIHSNQDFLTYRRLNKL